VYFNDDTVNIALEKAKDVDGFIFGSPVHYAGASGVITSFLDRFFYAGSSFQYKPGAAIVSCRRGGATAAFDQLNKYFTISNMPIVSSQYWNMVHGNTPEEVVQDLEGMQIMRTLGKNMAWLLKSIEAGKKAGVSLPKKEEKVRTNFIR
jgi:multimeric flavodoxin WrbA